MGEPGLPSRRTSGRPNCPLLPSPPGRKIGTRLQGGTVTKNKRHRNWTAAQKLKIVLETRSLTASYYRWRRGPGGRQPRPRSLSGRDVLQSTWQNRTEISVRDAPYRRWIRGRQSLP